MNNTNKVVMHSLFSEALEVSPNIMPTIVHNSVSNIWCRMGELGSILREATPHGRFQMLVALLLSLCSDTAIQSSSLLNEVIRRVLNGFYLVELVAVLSALSADELIEIGLNCSEAASAEFAIAVWRYLKVGATAVPVAGGLAPLHTQAEALQVLKLAANPFLAKVQLLLSLLNKVDELPFDDIACLGRALTPSDEHVLLVCPEFGLPDVEEMLFPGIHSGVTSSLDHHTVSIWLGSSMQPIPRGMQPQSPLLLIVINDSWQASTAEDEVPSHIWQMSAESFQRLTSTNSKEVVDLGYTPSLGGQLLCVAYRLTLPIVTGRIYQKFYTQFVHARCPACRTAPSIPTLCLLCGTFLCCNSECCRRSTPGEAVLASGEVTQHAQQCAFGMCVFLQLSNSLVHIVADSFIACWGSLYLDGHGEEEYNLARPLHISEARLQQLTQTIREISFDFESRLKWKKVIFV